MDIIKTSASTFMPCYNLDNLIMVESRFCEIDDDEETTENVIGYFDRKGIGGSDGKRARFVVKWNNDGTEEPSLHSEESIKDFFNEAIEKRWIFTGFAASEEDIEEDYHLWISFYYTDENGVSQSKTFPDIADSIVYEGPDLEDHGFPCRLQLVYMGEYK